jgi:hypothetical protein
MPPIPRCRFEGDNRFVSRIRLREFEAEAAGSGSLALFDAGDVGETVEASAGACVLIFVKSVLRYLVVTHKYSSSSSRSPTGILSCEQNPEKTASKEFSSGEIGLWLGRLVSSYSVRIERS